MIRRHRSLVAAATAAVCTLAFAPAPTALSNGGATAARTSTARTGVPTSATGGALVRLAEDGTVDRSAFERGLAGMAPRASLLDRQARRDGLRTLLVDAGATPLAPALCLDMCGGEGYDDMEYEPESYAYSFVEAYVIGDVDGDATEDLGRVSYEYSYDADTDTETESSDIAVLSGVDGSTLWALDEIAGYAAVTPDLDGDGLADVATITFGFEFTSEDSCDDDGCTTGESFSDAMAFTFRRGLDGAPLGATELHSRFGYEYAESYSSTGPVYEGQSSSRFFDEGLVTELAFMPGDNGAAMLLGTIDLEESWEQSRTGVNLIATDVRAHDAAERFAVASLVELVDPLTGSRVTLADSAVDGRLTLPRATADGSIIAERFDAIDDSYEQSCVDVAIVTSCDGLPLPGPSAGTDADPSQGGSVALLESDGTIRWEVPLSESSAAVAAAGGDIDGDGVADLLDLSYDEDFNDIVIAMSGADGSTLWTSEFLFGQVSGDVVVGLAVRQEEDGYELDAVTVDNATGAILARRMLGVLWSFEDGPGEEPGEEAPESFIETFLFVDYAVIDGDGLDLLVERFVVEFFLVEEECYVEVDEQTGEEYEYCWRFYEGETIDGETAGYDGQTLATVFHRDADAEGYLAGLVDLEGDGPAELLIGSYDQETDTSRLAAERLSGSTVWTLDGDNYLTGVLQRADGAVDLVLLDWVTGETKVRNGRTLAVRYVIR